jgi:hypothetical protein
MDADFFFLFVAPDLAISFHNIFEGLISYLCVSALHCGEIRVFSFLRDLRLAPLLPSNTHFLPVFAFSPNKLTPVQNT